MHRRRGVGGETDGAERSEGPAHRPTSRRGSRTCSRPIVRSPVRRSSCRAASSSAPHRGVSTPPGRSTTSCTSRPRSSRPSSPRSACSTTPLPRARTIGRELWLPARQPDGRLPRCARRSRRAPCRHRTGAPACGRLWKAVTRERPWTPRRSYPAGFSARSEPSLPAGERGPGGTTSAVAGRPARMAWITDEHRDRYVPHMERYNQRWCQLLE